MNRDNDSNFFTQAGSFTSAISGGVDPRTGLYNLSITLGHINGNNQMGPQFPITLSYSPQSQGNMGFGTGVSLGVSTYDTSSGRLSLSTGEQYQTDENTSSVTVKQKKLDNFKFEKHGGESYRVTHKTGDVEILRGEDYGSSLKLPVRMINAAGHSLSLATDNNNRLISVSDESSPLLWVAYDDRVTLTFYPGTQEKYSVILQTNNDLLTTITRRTTGEPDLVWHIQYEDTGFWGQWATAMTSPSGLQDTVIYRCDGYTHRFPDSAPQSLRNNPMPYVTKRTLAPGAGQPIQVSVYSYSDYNYLGYDSGVDWEATQDNLYNCLDNYIYSSVETQGVGIASKTITREYNSYHLQVSEETSSGSNSVLKTTEYYAKLGTPFENQPEQFQLPRTITTMWSEGSTGLKRTETVITAFNESGNPVSQTDADGTVTQWEYYPANGSDTDCPPEPNGFTRFMKSETVTPRKTAYSTPAHKTAYTYATFEHASTDVSALVMKATEKHFADDVLLKTISCQYGTKAANTAGVMTKKTTTYPDPTDNKREYTTTETVDFTDPGVNGNNIDAWVSAYTLTSHDGLTVTRSRTVSCMTGRLLESTDNKGNVTAYTYNSLGWLTKRVHVKDTAYEHTTTYEYTVDATSGVFYATTTDPSGNKVRHGLDGMGRLLHIKKNDVDMDSKNSEPEFLMQQQTRDALGRSLTGSTHDYQQAANKNNPTQTVTQTQRYDNWGLVSESVSSEGVTTYTETVLVLPPTGTNCIWQLRSWQSGGTDTSGITVTTLDDNHNSVKTELYPKNAQVGKNTPYSVTYSEYDGWNQLRSQTDELGQTTTYKYDDWGRPTITTLPDNTQTHRAYVAFSSAKLPVSISVLDSNNIPVPGVGGTQTFDGLGRLKSTIIGGRHARYSYQFAYQRHPTVIYNEAGNQEVYTYINALGEAPESLRASGVDINVSQDWTYNPVTAAMMTATEDKDTENQHSLRYGYATSGQQTSVTVEKEGDIKEKSTNLMARTIGGTATTVRDYAGGTQTLTLDILGRATALDDADVSSTLTYDGLGQVTQWTVTSKKNHYTKTTTLTLDEYGRETQRTIETWDARNTLKDTLTVVQVWSKKHQVTHRTTTQTTAGKTVTLRDESYDFAPERGWLMRYTVSGSTPPQDETGKALSRQDFTYDSVTSNMTTKSVTYTDDTTTFTMYLFENKDDQCQLTGIRTDTGTTTSLKYDDAGRLTQDEYGRMLSYDALGRLCKVTLNGSTLTRYRYDAGNQLSGQTVGDTTTRYYYGNSTLAYMEDDATPKNAALLTPHAQVRTGKNAGIWLTSSDMAESVLSVTDGTTQENYAYTPYGARNGASSNDEAIAVTGYNGERLDGTLNQYHLGNGYRAYNPVLQRFTCPDSLSPFGDGGINPYIYCEGDPVNRTDPTGHLFTEIALAARAAWKAIRDSVLVRKVTDAAGGIWHNGKTMTDSLFGKRPPKNSLGRSFRDGDTAAGSRKEPRLQKEVDYKVTEASRSPMFKFNDNIRKNPEQLWSLHEDNGKYIYNSHTKVNGYGVEKAYVNLKKISNKPIDIISGSHGGNLGEGNWVEIFGPNAKREGVIRNPSYLEHKFLMQDLATLKKNKGLTDRVYNIKNLDRNELNNILRNPNTNVILGYCYSANDNYMASVDNRISSLIFGWR
ncbi:putative Nematicidal protein 2 [Xenorhabdus nematophila ATCC 19061]|uniref:Nematicidal protein 2 n=1 Tax=Xenorhabdus nematophila (strain ATCC 19061 / DSM 3370 / CCUG 14189 / LMG 1036 / NCIMB 9965 / AN6) TaxID=406817 RepID=D3VCX4_XENNA|nr:RHS repeat-associated core domain-containing protein [Xenorhabdus nematophila]CBJ89840.1 putative Nematicidal protein 2 [Xenorhabdus nematophila ATCC 19061]CEK22724.1 putative Nematicidal protein 2 [Xenorhabdus nematophila AN6/1]